VVIFNIASIRLPDKEIVLNKATMHIACCPLCQPLS
jgi:hypothetical protein